MTTEPMRPLVRFRDVGKTYDGVTQIVEHLDLDILEGEFLTLLGPSGSGKTTCLMMLAGFESPSSGEIWLGDSLINAMPPHKRNIGMVFQNYALFPHMSVAQNVGYALTVRRVDAAAKAASVQRALDMVRMAEFADRQPAKLSGGQQQRVALARALVFNPRLVLMDEPLGALDKRLREHMQIELKELHRQLGITFVYVTHDQSEALTMSDRVAVFDSGRIQQIDRVDSLYEAPANGIVANFVGDTNVFTGTVVALDDGYCVIGLPDGARLRGQAASPLRVGDTVCACARPERISVLDGNGLGPDGRTRGNLLRARANDAIYFGDHMRLRFSLPGQATCFIKLSLDNPMLHRFSPGSDLLLGFSAEHLRVFPDLPSTLSRSHHAFI
jgi:putative spermidine/putrescine transport system ATP-binding protein